MTTLTTQTLGETVGATVAGVDCDRLLGDDDLPGGAWKRSRRTALSSSGACTSTMRPRWRSARNSATSSRSVDAIRRRSFGSRWIRPRTRWRPTCGARSTGTSTGAPTTCPSWRLSSAPTPSPPAGGATEFASSYVAYETLSDREKERADSVRVVHTFEAAQRLVNDDPSPEELAKWRTRPSKEHPLVWHHRSGRRSLVLGATASHVVGMDLAEGRGLLADLLARSTVPERVYRHVWEVGDMVIWDNRGVLHRATPYDPASPRDMHRCTLAGDEVIQ